MGKRDNFPPNIKRVLAARAGHKCSNPYCKKATSGPQSDTQRAVNIGVAAHITAAAMGGPRFDQEISPDERRSINNGIWLCQVCAKLIDDDENRYTVFVLADWKATAEEGARSSIERPLSALQRPLPPQLPLAGVLLPQIGASIQFESDERCGVTIDYSIYPFFIEELVSLGVSSIVIAKGSPQEEALPMLSKHFVDRVKVIDLKDEMQRVNKLFSSIADELDVEFEWPNSPIYGLGYKKKKGKNFEEINKDICTACAQLRPIILDIAAGAKFKVGIEIDFQIVERWLSVLRQNLRSREAREASACLSWLFAGYKYKRLESISMTGPPSNQPLSNELVLTDNYRRLSNTAFGFGSTEHPHERVGNFQSAVKSFLKKSVYGDRFKGVQKGIGLFSKEGDESRAGIGLILPSDRSYVPPVLPFGQAKALAAEAWKRVAPPPITAGTPINDDEPNFRWHDRSAK